MSISLRTSAAFSRAFRWGRRWRSRLSRQQVRALRLPDAQKPLAQHLGDYMTVRADTWQQIAVGVRANDEAMIRAANAKQEAAVVALTGIMPGRALSDRVDPSRLTRAAAADP